MEDHIEQATAAPGEKRDVPPLKLNMTIEFPADWGLDEDDIAALAEEGARRAWRKRFGQ